MNEYWKNENMSNNSINIFDKLILNIFYKDIKISKDELVKVILKNKIVPEFFCVLYPVKIIYGSYNFTLSLLLNYLILNNNNDTIKEN